MGEEVIISFGWRIRSAVDGACEWQNKLDMIPDSGSRLALVMVV